MPEITEGSCQFDLLAAKDLIPLHEILQVSFKNDVLPLKCFLLWRYVSISVFTICLQPRPAAKATARISTTFLLLVIIITSPLSGTSVWWKRNHWKCKCLKWAKVPRMPKISITAETQRAQSKQYKCLKQKRKPRRAPWIKWANPFNRAGEEKLANREVRSYSFLMAECGLQNWFRSQIHNLKSKM